MIRVSDINQQPPTKMVKKLYTSMLLRYKGPEPRSYGQYNDRYRPDKKVCKDGWCHSEFSREIAMGAILDRSDTHNLAPAKIEEAVDLEPRPGMF